MEFAISSSENSSDSDSDRTEQQNDNVKIAFEVMKEKLSNVAHKCTVKPGHLRQKLYETFSKDYMHSSDSSDEDNDAKQETEISQTEELKSDKIDLCDFFIDKGSNKTEINDDDTPVETIDLSDMVLTAALDDSKSNKEKKTQVKDEREKGPEKQQKIKKAKKKKSKDKKDRNALSSELQTKISTKDVYINVDPYRNPKGLKPVKPNELRNKEPEIMKKSVITDEFEKQDSIATNHVSRRQQKRERKLEREKTKGEKWYHMPAVELTEEQKNDLTVLQMRKALDPKRFYKANDMSVPPKFVQFGKVIENAADFYDSRIPKKQRKSNIVEELLADAEFRKYNKRKYEEIQDARRLGKGPYKHMKRLKKQKK